MAEESSRVLVIDDERFFREAICDALRDASIDYITAGFDESHAVLVSYEAPLIDARRLRYKVYGSWSRFTASDVGFADDVFEGEGWSVGGDLRELVHVYAAKGRRDRLISSRRLPWCATGATTESHVPLNDHEFELLTVACGGHSDGLQKADTTVMTCWDADRLDLGRVGITPDPNRLFTAPAKQKKTIDAAYKRSMRWVERFY